MELEKFIISTLTDIVNGVKNANKEFQTTDKFVLNNKDEISFDIAITITESSKKGGEAGIHVYAIKLGGEKGSSNYNENVSRIKFKVKPNYSIA